MSNRKRARTPTVPASLRPALPFLDERAPVAAPVAANDPGKPGRRPQQRRRDWLKLSALACVALPTLLAAIYYALIAAPQYAVEMRFAVRGGAHVASPAAGSELISSLAGLGSASSTLSDAFIVMDFVKSRELIEKMQPAVDVRRVYAHPAADFLVRLDPAAQIEDLVDYWRWMLEVNLDTVSQIITVKVRAFTREDAMRVGESVLGSSEDLINSLSERARLDALKFAEQEVKRTEDRLRVNRTLVRQFRDQQQEIDPLKKADSQLSLLSRVESDLSTARARMATLRRYMQEDAPSVAFLSSQIKALERQVEQERGKLGKGADVPAGVVTLSSQVAAYEELLVEREFAEKAYVSALAALEKARIEAAQQQRYLATFVRPSLPQDALYPRRVLNTFTVLGLSVLLWALGVLIVYAIRDHAT
jgi:capsular polysaccharide transport system permease protein